MEATNLKEEWEMFEQRFDLFITATDSGDKPEATRVGRCCDVSVSSAIGAEARRVYNSFVFATEADKKKLDSFAAFTREGVWFRRQDRVTNL